MKAWDLGEMDAAVKVKQHLNVAKFKIKSTIFKGLMLEQQLLSQ